MSNAQERENVYTTWIRTDDLGRIQQHAVRPTAWRAVSWAEEPNVVTVPGMHSVHAVSSYVENGQLKAKAKLEFRCDAPVVPVGSTHTVRTLHDGVEVSAGILVDGQYHDVTPCDITWTDPARVRVQIDDVKYAADDVRIRFEASE